MGLILILLTKKSELAITWNVTKYKDLPQPDWPLSISRHYDNDL